MTWDDSDRKCFLTTAAFAEKPPRPTETPERSYSDAPIRQNARTQPCRYVLPLHRQREPVGQRQHAELHPLVVVDLLV